jgi:hypothetical protein
MPSTKPSSANTRSEGPLVTGLVLQCLHLQLDRPSAPLRPAIEAALAQQGRPLRWAITAASEEQLWIEAVVEVRVDDDEVGADDQAVLRGTAP